LIKEGEAVIKRIIIPAVLVVMILLGESGCMNIFPKSDETVRDELLEYLNFKYNEEFIALSLERGYSDVLQCYVQDGDTKADRVYVQRIDNDGKIEYKDTYFGVLIRDDIETKIQSLCSGFDLPLKFFYPSDIFYYDNSFDGTKTFVDFKRWISDGNAWRFDITVVMAVDDVSEGITKADELFEMLGDSDMRWSVDICVIPSEGFVDITRTNLNDILAQHNGRTAVYSQSIN
jgi:hypothetical protein